MAAYLFTTCQDACSAFRFILSVQGFPGPHYATGATRVIQKLLGCYVDYPDEVYRTRTHILQI
jgi:hypothetical protein